MAASTVSITSSSQQIIQKSRCLGTGFGFLITFIGICHETIGQKLFPWGGDLLGTLWHPAGFGLIFVGLWFCYYFIVIEEDDLKNSKTKDMKKDSSLALSLRRPHFIRRITRISAFIVFLAGIGISIFSWFYHDQFHLFAVVGGVSGLGVIFCDHTISGIGGSLSTGKKMVMKKK